jgi:hypothetical protein
MAVEYHLITPFGLTTTVTVDATANTLALATHGMRAGQGFYFLTTSTTLPQVGGVNVSTSTPYYVASDSLAAGTFKVVTASDGSGTPLDFSSAGSSVKIAGKYWTELPTTDPGNGGNYKNRYYYGSAYQVYSGMIAWENGWGARKDYKTALTLEIQGGFTDSQGTFGTTHALQGLYSLLITSRVNGSFDPDSFHYGVIGGGYSRVDATCSNGASIYITGNNVTVEGIEITATAASSIAIRLRPGCIARNCILKGTNDGIYAPGGGSKIEGNLIHSCSVNGISIQAYYENVKIINNTIIGCGTGLSCTYTANITVVGNVIFGCTTANWGATTGNTGYWNNNAGLTGEAWTSTGATRVVIDSTAFKNYVVPVDATSDFSPSGDSTAHTSSSALVDIGSQEFVDLMALDLAGNVRPSYKNGSATNWDIGCYEFDWGYGDAPASTVITITAQASLSGAEVRIYDLDNSPAGTYGTELSGTESHNASTYTYTGSTGNVIGIQIMQSGYEEFTQTITLENSTQSLNITLRPDINA